MNLTYLDLAVITVPLGIVLLISFWMNHYMRSVADFLAAGRCAGRYLICTAAGETGGSVMVMITALEVFSRTGVSLSFWQRFSSIIPFAFGLIGLVVYRFRQTRSLTFHQFFEVRYSKGVRVFASALNVFSGLFYFGLQPAVGARFFVYFCGLPEQCVLGGITLPTFIPVMLVLMGMSLFFALSGGQISVMVTDCLEGVVSMFFYLIISFFIVYTVSMSEMREALLSGPVGGSYIDPFDIGTRSDFNGWYIVCTVFLSMYYYRGNAVNQGFIAAAKTPHEGRMAGVLGNWRLQAGAAMSILVSLAAFTLLHDSDFAAQRAMVDEGLKNVGTAQLVTQMRMPMALGILLAPGVKGAFCAVLLFGLLAAQGVQLHGFGSTFLQDVILPLRKKPFEPGRHVRALKLTVLGVAAFVTTFSIIFKPVDYLAMIAQLMGAIYLGGIGLVCWGGLYWKKGTTQAAWTALCIGSALGVGCNLIQQFWPAINYHLMQFPLPVSWNSYLAGHVEKFPFNGIELSVFISITAGLSYIIVSLLTCREDFDLDQMLHRGKYRIEEDGETEESGRQKSWLYHFLQIDEGFDWKDKLLTLGTFYWTVFWLAVTVIVLLWTLLVDRLSPEWWFSYTMVTGVWLSLVLGVVTTIWFSIGVYRDMKELLVRLKAAKRVDSDDGTVIGHRNASEMAPNGENFNSKESISKIKEKHGNLF